MKYIIYVVVSSTVKKNAQRENFFQLENGCCSLNANAYSGLLDRECKDVMGCGLGGSLELIHNASDKGYRPLSSVTVYSVYHC